MAKSLWLLAARNGSNDFGPFPVFAYPCGNGFNDVLSTYTLSKNFKSDAAAINWFNRNKANFDFQVSGYCIVDNADFETYERGDYDYPFNWIPKI